MDIVDKGRKPVVNAIFFADSIPILKIYKSKYILDNSNSFEFISDASIKMNVNDSVYDLVYNHLTNAYENLSVLIHENQKIKINVTTSIGNARAETIVPYNVPILYYDTLPHYDKEGNYDGTEIKITFSDPINDHNYYIFTYLSNDADLSNNMIQNIPGFQIIGHYLFIDDIAMNGKNITISYIARKYYYGEKGTFIEFILMHVDEHLYRYQLSAKKQDGFSPFSEPVLIYNNINVCGSVNISRAVIHFQ